jgi:molybdenum cofactor guanylyltransferase
MGMDKGLIDYHGKPQREYLLDLLYPFTTTSYISCRPGQIIGTDLPLLEDTYHDLGPFGGILSAFAFDPSCAWLVVACDFPLLDKEAMQELIEARDPSSIATSFLDEHEIMPEPWITILEPKIYPILLEYLHRGRSSLRGILEDQGSHVITPRRRQILLNANTPEEVTQIRKLIPLH